MVEPLACLSCPQCDADTVFALRTPDSRNHCHCSTCGHVWRDEQPRFPPAEVAVRVKRDRRARNNSDSRQFRSDSQQFRAAVTLT